MKRYLLPFIFYFAVVPAVAQEKIATIDPGNGFYSGDQSAGYYDKYRNEYRINLQNGSYLTRLLYDINFNLADSFSYLANDISFNYTQEKRLYFLTNISPEGENLEVYANQYKVIFVKPDFKEKKDRRIYEHIVKQTEEDERLLAVFPAGKQVKILSVSFNKDKLFIYSWQAGGNITKVDFDLPESNITDPKQKKDIPKTARIKFQDQLGRLSVKPLKQTTLTGYAYKALYYSDDAAYILLHSPYNLGVYLMEFDLVNNRFKGTNYFVNTLKENASDNINLHKNATGILYDSLLIIKNASDRIYEYYFYNIKTGNLLKKHSSSPGELKNLIHSDMKQKGSWASANEEKDIDNYKAFLRKAGRGSIFTAAVSSDSLTITNMAIQQTTGIEGALLGVFVPMPLNMLGIPFYVTAMLPPLGLYRNKIIYAHSRFSVKDLSLSKSTLVTTVLDKLLDNRNAEIISRTSSFLINRDGAYFLGVYSKDSKKIEVYKYDGSE